MKSRSPYIAYIQDVEEYLAVIEDRLNEAIKRAIYSNDQRAADSIAEITEKFTDLHIDIYKFLTKSTMSKAYQEKTKNLSKPAPTPLGYPWKNPKNECNEKIDEEELNLKLDLEEEFILEERITVIPDPHKK